MGVGSLQGVPVQDDLMLTRHGAREDITAGRSFPFSAELLERVHHRCVVDALRVQARGTGAIGHTEPTERSIGVAVLDDP